MYGLSIVCLILAVGVAVVAMVFYGRARETEGVPKEQEKWVLLFATWRDSLITSVLIFMIVVTRVIAISRWLGLPKS